MMEEEEEQEEEQEEEESALSQKCVLASVNCSNDLIKGT